MEERARRLADSRRDAGGVPRLQVHDVDLVELIPRFPFALERQPPPVRGPVALAGAPALHREAPDPREEIPLAILGLRLSTAAGNEQDADHDRRLKIPHAVPVAARSNGHLSG